MRKPTAIADTGAPCGFTCEGSTVFAFADSSCLSCYPLRASPAGATVGVLALGNSVALRCVPTAYLSPCHQPWLPWLCVCTQKTTATMWAHTCGHTAGSCTCCCSALAHIPRLALAAAHMAPTHVCSLVVEGHATVCQQASQPTWVPPQL